MAASRSVSKRSWQLQEAKANLSRVIDRCQSDGPQTVTRHGRPVAVVLRFEEFARLSKNRPDFKAFLRTGGLDGVSILRESDEARDVDL